MEFNTNKLLELGLLRKIPASKEKAEESMKTARAWIKEAENNLNIGSFRSCILTSYLAMFHAARSILFMDGFREKSHFAVARYLEDKYTARGLLEEKYIDLLDHYREIRHDDQYSTLFITTEEEVSKTLDSSKKFVERIGKLLKSKVS